MHTWFDAKLDQKILNVIYYTAQKKRIELETENWWTEVFFGVALVSKLSFLKVIWLNLTLFGTGFERMKKCPYLAPPRGNFYKLQQAG